MTIRALHKDGWTNFLAGFGKKKKDKTENTAFIPSEIITDEELSNIYDSDGLGTSIIDMVVDDMLRTGIHIEKDEKGAIQVELNRIKATDAIGKAMKYARLYRGAIVVMITERGLLDSPLTLSSGKIKNLRVYSAARIDLSSIDIIDDANSAYFEDVEFFSIVTKKGTTKKVHRSRCLIFKGELASDANAYDLNRSYWGMSVLQRTYSRLSNYGIVEKAIADLLFESNVGKYTLSNLAQILSQNTPEALNMIYDRIEIINASKSIINAVLLGEGESYETEAVNLSGIGEIFDRMMMNLSSVTGYPVTKLFGRSAAGMNATGEGDLVNYYDRVSAKQESWLLSEYQYLVNHIASYVYSDTLEYKIIFNPLWELSQKEKAEIDKMYSETDRNNIEMELYSSEEARKMRYSHLDEIDDAFEFEEEEEEE